MLELFLRWVQSGFSNDLPPKADLIVPFFKTVSYPLGVFGFIILTYFVIVGASNAVNLTDGLDGLAIMPVVMVGSALGVFAYVTGSAVYSPLPAVPVHPRRRRAARSSAPRWPARGSPSSGSTPTRRRSSWATSARSRSAARSARSPSSRARRSCSAIMGGVFVAEALSVMVQVTWFKYTRSAYGEGRRIFLMAPLHHHFEKTGWKETQVVVRFWIITMLLCLVGLASLKLR